MIDSNRLRRMVVTVACVTVTATGCSFHGLNSLPLPGTVGRGSDATIYHAEFANIGTLESNSPVMIDDVVVGSVGKMTFSNWHIDLELSVNSDVEVPANAVARVGQTSLLGSMHVSLDPPIDQAPTGKLPAGSTIPLDSSMTFPSTEQTLASISTVVNGGGLGQIGDIIHSFNAALSGREDDVRDLLGRLNEFVAVVDTQRANIVASLHALNRLGGSFASQRDAINRVLKEAPPALDVLNRERPRITAALDKLRVLSNTSVQLVKDTQSDLVANLTHLEPTLRALADVGKDLDHALAFATAFPYGQSLIDRGVRGDYMNVFQVLDFTIPRLKRSTMLGTRWGQEGASLVPAPGEPNSVTYTLDPLLASIAPPPGGVPAPGEAPAPASVAVTPPPPSEGPSTPSSPDMIFAGPYGAQSAAAPAAQGGGS
ncbi:MCE family protein [Mycolicibacterium setense]|uniref:MCE family protein n=1 Tax=Mycolicibacterium setense TaxID=431269 RepID=UPI0009EE30CB|nr:MCE family protein [Mycolicibacterium setense]